MTDRERPAGREDAAARHPLRVLIVEDSALDAELMVRELTRYGFAVQWRRVCGAEPLQRALDEQPWDVVLSDYVMPGFSGLDALGAVRRHDDGLPFILLSGTIGEELAVAAMRAGAHDYLLKSEFKRLGTAVERQLRDAEQRRARRRVDEALHLRTRALDAAANAIVITDIESRCLWANPAFTRLTGYAPEEYLGRTLPELLRANEHPPEFFAELWRTVLAGRVWHGELVNRRKDGSLYTEEQTITPVTDEAGRLTHFVTVKQDVSDRYRAEARVREHAALLDAANDAIYVRDLDDRLTYWNRSAHRLHGFDHGASAANALLTHASVRAARAQAIAEGNWAGELRLERDGAPPVVVFSRCTLLRDAQGRPTGILAIDADVTAQKQLEAQYYRAQRLEGIGVLASGIAHDLNNILAPILMLAPLLHAAVATEEDRQQLDTIEQCARRGADIVRQLLTFARGTPGTRTPVSVGQLVREVERLARETFPRHLHIAAEVPDDLWGVLGHSTRLQQVLVNLAVNARDAMPAGGTLRFGADNVTLAEPPTGVHGTARAGRYVRLRVSDTGTGIQQEHLEHLFDPFFTTKGPGEGSGLGLPTVLGIVNGHEGFLRVDSTPGVGATFEVYLPALADTAAGALAVRPDPPRGRGELVLVVDDEDLVRSSLTRTLVRHGYRAVSAANGRDALEVFADRGREIAIVLTDMMMPVMGGAALAATLRSQARALPIVGMTGLSDRRDDAAGLNLTATLRKPFERDDLLAVLAQVLGRTAGDDQAR